VRDNPEFELTVGDRSWRLSMGAITVGEWCELEELSGMDAAELLARFMTGGMRARRAMLYLARKRAGDPVPWDSPELTGVPVGEMTMRQIPKPPRKSKKAEGEGAPTAGSPDPTPVAETSASATP
jgi:hypothetical protein